jgi:hypothetical protein
MPGCERHEEVLEDGITAQPQEVSIIEEREKVARGADPMSVCELIDSKVAFACPLRIRIAP